MRDGWTRRLIEIGAALSAERDHDRLLERILLEAMAITRADGGTLYLHDEEMGRLRFAILRNQSMNLALGGTTGHPIPFPPVSLYDAESGQPNLANVAAFVAIERRTSNLRDVYQAIAFDFSGTQAYDARTGYRSKSFLTVPLVSVEGRLIGVLQLINAQDEDGHTIPFSKEMQPVIEALASQAAVAIENHRLLTAQRELADAYRRLLDIGTALSSESDHDRLLETILEEARKITRADGGTLYIYDDDAHVLRFAILRNTSLDLAMGGTTGEPIPYPPVPMEKDGQPNLTNVAAYVGLQNEVVSLPDVYADDDAFDFDGAKAYDARTGYRSKSFLTVPLRTTQDALIGVLQLINAQDEHGAIVPFSDSMCHAVIALASQAAVAIDNRDLIEAQKALLESFIQTIARAIDLKSPYTGGHCQRVPVLTEMLARAAIEASEAPFADFELDEDGMYELSIAAWLHDCGKVTIPEYVVDKATKLETLTDRLETVRARFLLIEREAEVRLLRAALEPGADRAALDAELVRERADLRDAFAFIARCNQGSEMMSDEDIARLHTIAERWRWQDASGRDHPALDQDELDNLSIRRGTLNPGERAIIESHMTATIDMLERLPFPKHLRRVPEYAGAHHEKLDGSGYPRGLTESEMSIPQRIMAIADVFEALTAGDRPYKKAKTLSEAVKILSFMVKDGHIDGDLFKLFLRSGIYRTYAEEHLLPAQLDAVDESRYLD